jgi:hypothetical protein
VLGSNDTSRATFKKTPPVHIVTASSPYYGLYQSTLTIINSGATAIQGSLEIALTGLAIHSRGVQLQDATVNVGSTTETLSITTDSAGDPVVFVVRGICPQFNPAPRLILRSVGLTLVSGAAPRGLSTSTERAMR